MNKKPRATFVSDRPCIACGQAIRCVAYRRCVACMKRRSSEHYRKNRDAQNATARMRRLADIEAARQKDRVRHARDREKRVAQMRAYAARHADEARVRAREYYEANREKYMRRAKARIDQLRTRTPRWADKKKIVLIYSECPTGSHVDHIIPLNGKNVCGLHVPENLQYLPASENLRKHNKFDDACLERRVT